MVRVFVKVVQLGSFTRAGEILRQPKSTISKAVSRLERETGTKLLMRTTRSLTLTAAGRAFFETCLPPIQVLEDAHKSIHGQDSIVSGTVRITAPEDLGSYVISPAVAELTRRHPSLHFELHYTDEIVDLVKHGFDLAIRIGRLQESGLRARKLGEIHLLFVASARYLKERDKPKRLADLKSHDCLTIASRGASWPLRSVRGESASFKIQTRILTNQMTGLMTLALNGAGVALVPHYLCRRELDEGHLIRVLPDWSSPGLSVSLLSPLGTSSAARLKITAEHLSSAIEKELKKI